METDYIPGDEDWMGEQNPKRKKKDKHIEKSVRHQERPPKGSKAIAAPVPGSIELQDAACKGVKYKHLPKCMACIVSVVR